MHYYFSIANMVVQVTPRIIIFLGFVKYVHIEGDPPTVSALYIISKMSVDYQYIIPHLYCTSQPKTLRFYVNLLYIIISIIIKNLITST